MTTRRTRRESDRQELRRSVRPRPVAARGEPVPSERGGRRESRESLPPEPTGPHEALLHFYTSAIVSVRDAFQRVQEGAAMPHLELAHLAMDIAVLVEREADRMLGVLPMARIHCDDGARAVQSAMLAALVAHRTYADRGKLYRLTLGGLLADLGHLHVSRADEWNPVTARAVVAATLRHSLAVADPDDDWLAATVFATETAYLERQRLVDAVTPPARGPSLAAQLLWVCRTFLEETAPRQPGRKPRAPTDALRAALQLPGVSPLALQALVATVGVLPVGTVVELASGAWAVVAAPPSDWARPLRPAVLVVTDGQGRALAQPRPMDLAICEGSEVAIAGVVPPEQSRFNVAWAFFAETERYVAPPAPLVG